ncbi:MAG: EI24 domain-containing protein [Oligoflexia bacterium]|nr:EI24 domain-containing protein [Oligoflexia bacterium]
MVNTPLKALRLFFGKPKLFVLGSLPGLLTFCLSSALLYWAWISFLGDTTLWLSIPIGMLLFLLIWLVVGNISLLPFEDPIIDECQRIKWSEVKIKSPPFGLRRIGREFIFSLFLILFALFSSIISFIPIIGWFSFLLATWLNAYSFLATLYARKEESFSGRIKLFFADIFHNTALGIFLTILLFVPVINVFLLGYAQILATLIFLDRQQAKLR